MFNQTQKLSLRLFALVSISIVSLGASLDWGFYAHKKINRMAVFTLPEELLALYKPHIYYLTEHAVDPDKRRFVLKNEAYRHYIDIDHWDTFPFSEVPREFKEAILKNGQFKLITIENDTLLQNVPFEESMKIYDHHILEDRYSVLIELNNSISYFEKNLSEGNKLVFENKFVEYGVLPYFLNDFYWQLVKAFEKRNLERILKISADIGHYLGDAHVPLHTTENYNGQLSDQLGIHAFWESRLPELFAEAEYDFIAGKAEYISDKEAFFWDVIFESHLLLEKVLVIEKELSQEFPSDQQYCFDNRKERTVWTQCPAYAEAYHNRMQGMVEERMRNSILALGSVWYSAWIDGGQPSIGNILGELDVNQIAEDRKRLDEAVDKKIIYGREH